MLLGFLGGGGEGLGGSKTIGLIWEALGFFLGNVYMMI